MEDSQATERAEVTEVAGTTDGAQATEGARAWAGVVADFRQTIDAYAPRLLALGDAEASARRRSAEGWSAKQIVGHLIDSAANNHRRFVLAQTRDDLDFEGYAQEDWVRVQAYERAPWPQLVELWRAYNLHLAHVMAAAPAAELTRERAAHSLDRIAFRLVNADRPATLAYLMRDYVDHLKHHLGQIFPEDSGLS